MLVQSDTDLKQLLEQHPECLEFLWPFRKLIDENISVGGFAEQYQLPLESLTLGLTRMVKRALQSPCNYVQMRRNLVKNGQVNIAGYVSFTWQQAFTDELCAFAKSQGIGLNLNIFPKYKKKEFQNYLALCQSIDDLPDILIGKGFSSLNTQQFTDSWVKPGYFTSQVRAPFNAMFREAGLADDKRQYHTFGAEEFVMVYDPALRPNLALPRSWSDLLKPEYRGMISQMGKNVRDHFGFVMMFYLYHQHGEDGIRQFAANVKSKQHFSGMVKNLATALPETAPINLMHNFAKCFIRSDVRNEVQLINPTDGNPVVAYFFLLKQGAGSDAQKLAQHFYSPKIGNILERSGALHAVQSSVLAGDKKIRWVGWDTVKNAPLPYLKEYLSEIAYSEYTPETISTKRNHENNGL